MNSLLRIGDALLEVFEPVRDNMDLLEGPNSALLGWQEYKESLSIRHHVVTGPESGSLNHVFNRKGRGISERKRGFRLDTDRDKLSRIELVIEQLLAIRRPYWRVSSGA